MRPHNLLVFTFILTDIELTHSPTELQFRRHTNCGNNKKMGSLRKGGTWKNGMKNSWGGKENGKWKENSEKLHSILIFGAVWVLRLF